MSGHLVGELMQARKDGRLKGLKPTYVLAAIAIAEWCRADDRSGSVPWSAIEWAMSEDGERPASRRTAERAVGELKQRGVISVTKRGHKTHGRVRAPVYRVELLPPVKVAEASRPASATSASASQGGGSKSGTTLKPKVERVFRGGGSIRVAEASASASQGGGSKANVLPPQEPFASANANAPTSDDDSLDGRELLHNSLLTGDARAPAREVALADPPPRTPSMPLHEMLLSPTPPPGYCKFHPDGTDKPCRACGFAVKLLQDWYDHHRPKGVGLKLMALYGRPFTEDDARRIFGNNIDGEVIDGEDGEPYA